MLFDLYVAAPGWLQRLDPRTKFALVAGGVVLFLAAQSPLFQGLLLLLLHVGLWSSRVPWRRALWVFLQLRWVLLIVLLLFPWMAALPGQPLLAVGPLVMTDRSVLLAMTTASRLWGVSLLVTSLLFTTTQQELVRGLVALGLPYRWGFTLAIALRYIPSFARQVEQIQEAQAARGWDASRGDLLKRLQSLGPVFVALAIHVFRSVDSLTLAMTARGVGRDTPRTVRRPLRLRPTDWLVLGATGIVVGGLLSIIVQ